METRKVEIEQNVLSKNDELAAALRAQFAADRTLVVNLLSSPGSGKTTLLEETLRRLAPRYKVAALVGDQATENDKVRLLRSGAPVRQIVTGEECRLDADMISRALDGFPGERVDLLFIENVGNLICPAEYDLGEGLRAVLFSVTEGEDKPLKYPLAFRTAQVALITKTDIAEAVGFDRAAAYASIAAVNEGGTVLELSTRSGAGLDAWLALLEFELTKVRAAAALGV
ncbi:MAG: hydrogenase nickel incorporation protein HypB [Candidatus Velthaea sp.]